MWKCKEELLQEVFVWALSIGINCTFAFRWCFEFSNRFKECADKVRMHRLAVMDIFLQTYYSKPQLLQSSINFIISYQRILVRVDWELHLILGECKMCWSGINWINQPIDGYQYGYYLFLLLNSSVDLGDIRCWVELKYQAQATYSAYFRSCWVVAYCIQT